MGLSHEERYNGIVKFADKIHSYSYIIHKFREKYFSLYDSNGVDRLNESISKIWYEINKNNNESNYGSVSPYLSKESMNLYDSAIFASIENERALDTPHYFLDNFDPVLLIRNIGRAKPCPAYYEVCSSVLGIYHSCEELNYFLLRYREDDFYNKYRSLHVLVCEIMGICHSIISKDVIFAKAQYYSYLIKKLIKNDMIAYHNPDFADWLDMAIISNLSGEQLAVNINELDIETILCAYGTFEEFVRYSPLNRLEEYMVRAFLLVRLFSINYTSFCYQKIEKKLIEIGCHESDIEELRRWACEIGYALTDKRVEDFNADYEAKMFNLSLLTKGDIQDDTWPKYAP